MLILDKDQQSYIDKKEWKRIHSYDNQKYNGSGSGSGVYGAAFYAPKGESYYGESLADIVSNILKFAGDNKDAIKNVSDVATNVANTVGTVGNNRNTHQKRG